MPSVGLRPDVLPSGFGFQAHPRRLVLPTWLQNPRALHANILRAPACANALSQMKRILAFLIVLSAFLPVRKIYCYSVPLTSQRIGLRLKTPSRVLRRNRFSPTGASFTLSPLGEALRMGVFSRPTSAFPSAAVGAPRGFPRSALRARLYGRARSTSTNGPALAVRGVAWTTVRSV